jgi:hypothetical protein
MSAETPKTPTPRPSQEIATVGDVKQATHEEKRATWLSTVVAVVTIVGAVLGAYFFAIDRAEAAGVREAAKGVEDAAAVKKALELHVLEERDARRDMREGVYRLEKKQDAMLMRWNIPNPAPTPTP